MLVGKFEGQEVTLAAPIAQERKGEFRNELLKLFDQGFYRFVIDGKAMRFTKRDEVEALKLRKKYAHTIDLLIDKLVVTKEEMTRLQEGVEKAFSLTNGLCKVMYKDKKRDKKGRHKQVGRPLALIAPKAGEPRALMLCARSSLRCHRASLGVPH